MAEEEPKKVLLLEEVNTEAVEDTATPPPPPSSEETPLTPPTPLLSTPPVEDVAEEKLVVPAPSEIPPPPPPALESAPVLESVPESAEQKALEGSQRRDAVLARVETEKRISLIKAWEESEKSKAENKAHKKLSDVDAWESSQKAAVEAELKKIEEKLAKKKAAYIEKMKNKIAIIHKEAEEKRAIIEAKHGEDVLRAEETAAKYRATGTTPKKLFKFL